MVAKSARFLAPIALAAVAVGVYLIVHSTVVHHHLAVTNTSVSTTSARRHTPKHRPQPTFWVVKSGNTLSQISSKTGVSVTQLTALNPSLTASPNSLQTGQRLRLRRKR
jgi:LysM repeat protein